MPVVSQILNVRQSATAQYDQQGKGGDAKIALGQCRQAPTRRVQTQGQQSVADQAG